MEHGIDKRSSYVALAILCAGIFLAAVDQTVVVTVLPDMIDTLEGGFSSEGVERAGWIVTAYLFGYMAVLPLMGRIADRNGHRRTYNLGLVIFLAGSLLCAISTSLYLLIGFRAIQAVGGGMLVPISMAAAGHYFPPERRALAFGIIGAAGEAGAVLGPLYGAVLGQHLGWRAIFYLNAPLVLLIYWLVRRRVPESPRYPATIDYRSGLLLALALGLSIAGISGARELGWLTFGLPLTALGLLTLMAFIYCDGRAAEPLLKLILFTGRVFASANIAFFLLGAALITALVQVPSFAYSSGWPEASSSAPMIGGLLLIRLTLLIPVGAIMGVFLTRRLGSRVTAVSGFLFCATGLWRMSLWSNDVETLRQTSDLFLTGFGFGQVIVPISLSAIDSLRKSRMASGAAVLTGSRILGMTIGLTVLNSWGITEYKSIRADDPVPLPSLGSTVSGYIEELRIWETRNVEVILGVLSDFFLAAAVLCLLAVIPSLFLTGRRK